MNIIKPMLVTATILLSQVSIADENYAEGEKLYQQNCAVCHGSTGGMDIAKRIAPPIAAVRKHYIDSYSDEDSFVQAVSSWIEKQDESQSLMRGAIRKFKIMPPVAVSGEDAEKIATYIYAGKIEELDGFKKHVEEEHAKEGKDKKKEKEHNKDYGMKHEEGMHK